VLFVDLLGVRAMARGRAAGKNLRALDRAVSGTYRDFLKEDSPWPAAFFSDTLVVASPVLRDDEESALGGLIVQAAWLQLDLVAQGFFVRGALSLGKFHMRAGLSFGPALVEVYELEAATAIHPRIILGRDAERSQHDDLRFYGQPEESPQNLLLLRDDDGWTFINYLGILFDEPADPTPALAMHRDAIIERLRTHRDNRRHWEKYRWVAEYHNQVITTRIPEQPDLLVDAAEIVWNFASFA
jgi:hypothetical protein